MTNFVLPSGKGLGGGIYEILNTANGKRYIGSAVRICDRKRQHRYLLRCGKHHSPKLQAAWNKYGEATFVFRPLLICAPKDLLGYEQRCLDGLKPEYNINPVAGSSLGVKQTPEHRAKTSAARRGRVASAETKAKMSAARKGRKKPPRSAEYRANLSAAGKIMSAARNRYSNGRYA